MELDVRVRHAGAAADEAAGLEVIAGPEALAASSQRAPIRARAQERHLRIKRDWLAEATWK